MEHQIYRTVKVGESLEDGDVYPNQGMRQLLPIDGTLHQFPHDGSFCVLRPVSIERVTGTESAFPAFDGSGAVGGMTLREHYAGLAMQGFASKHQSWLAFDELALYSVRAADALIAALNKKEEAV